MYWDWRGVLICCLFVRRRIHQLCSIARAQLHSEQLAYCQILRKFEIKSFVFIIQANHKYLVFSLLLVFLQEMVFHWLAAVVLLFEAVNFLIRTFGIMNGLYCTGYVVISVRFIAAVSCNVLTFSNDICHFKHFLMHLLN